MVDYLSDEFLAGVDDEHRQRLLATSILEQLSGPLEDAVCGSTDDKQWVRETTAANQLVIGLDRTGEWFRYHHLFRDLLRVEANEAIPDQLSDHHRAVAHWLASGERREAARLMYFHGPRLIAENQIETLRRILDDLGDAGRADAACALLWGWSEFIAGRYSAAEQWVATTHDIAPDGFALTITAPLRINILLGRGDVDSALSIARELTDPDRLEALPPELAPVAVVAGGVLMWAGQRDYARSVLDVGVALRRA